MNVQAVLKIIKHCTESLPQMVAGSLLGLDQAGTLEVRGVCMSCTKLPFELAHESMS